VTQETEDRGPTKAQLIDRNAKLETMIRTIRNWIENNLPIAVNKNSASVREILNLIDGCVYPDKKEAV